MSTQPIMLGSLYQSSRTWEAVLWKVFSCACFAGINAYIRKLTKHDGLPGAEPLSVYMVLFWHHFLAFALLMPYLTFSNKLHYLKTDQLKAQIIRVVTAVGGLLLWYKGLGFMPLAEAQSIQHLSPLVLFASAVLFLSEKINIQKAMTLGLGLVGMILIAKPYEAWMSGQIINRELSLTLIGMSYIIASVVTLAVAKVLIKKLTSQIKPFELTTFMLAYMPLVAFVPAAIAGDWPTVVHMPYLFGTALLTLGAHYGMSRAFYLADLTLISPISYSKMLFSILLGYFLLGELPEDPMKWLGMALIVGSGFVASAYKAKKS